MPYLTVYRATTPTRDLLAYLPTASGPAGSMAYPVVLDRAWLFPAARATVDQLLPGEAKTTRIEAWRVAEVERASALRHGL